MSPCSRYHFAVAQPYSMSRFDAYRDTVLTKYDFVKSEVLTKTVQERDLHLLTITHPKNLGASVGSESECGDSVPPRETEQLEVGRFFKIRNRKSRNEELGIGN